MSTELRRPRVSAFLALSLDGFIAGEGGDPAWLAPYGGDGPQETGYSALMASADTLLMGRNTYDIVSAFPEWPYGDKPLVVLTPQARRPPSSGLLPAGGAGAGAGRVVAGGKPSPLSGWRGAGEAGSAGGPGGRADPVLGAGHPGGRDPRSLPGLSPQG